MVPIAVLACALIGLLPAASASAAIYQVAAGTPDAPDADPTDAFNCDAVGPPGCTLRAAVQTANGPGSPGPDKVQILSGGYTLDIDNVAGDENAAATGDLDLTSDVEIEGFGGPVTISGQGPPSDDRIFHIPSGLIPAPTVTMSGLTITKGEAPAGGWGGGIKHESGALAILNSSITQNNAVGDGARGGGIYSSGGSSLTLTDVNVNGNQAPMDSSGINGGQGGGIWSSTAVTFTRVAIFSNNAAFGCGATCGAYGGGLHVAGGTLTNVTVGSNIAGGPSSNSAGGGIAHAGSPLTLVNSTVEQNHALGSSGLGGGNLLDFGGGVSLQSTIVSNGDTMGHPAGTENCFADTGSLGSLTSLGHNLEARTGQGASSQCGLTPGSNGDLTATSAGLGTFDLHGGTTYNYELLPGSPAIDAGALSGPTTDQRGVSRPQGSRCDIGAFELAQGGTIPGSTCAGPPSPPVSTPPVSTPLLPTTTAAPPPPKKKCKKGRKLKKGKCVRKKKPRKG